MSLKRILCLGFLFIFNHAFAAEPLGIHLEGYNYPYPVKYFNLQLEKKSVKMAYMDVLPTGKSNNQTVVLLHGGLAFGAYWKETIKFLSEQGYRVIVPDQVGFGKSSKKNLHYSLSLLAKNTHDLLTSLQIKNPILIGHSMGGMLAIRYTLMFPEDVSKLVLEDPLGLEDYRLKIPYHSIDEVYKSSLNPTWEKILNIHKGLYAQWRPEFEEYADVAYRVSLNPKFSKVATVQAIDYEMIQMQPVVYELQQIKIPTLILYGAEDRTVPGKQYATPENQAKLGNFPELVKEAAEKIPNSKVISFEHVAHVPHLEVTKEFHAGLLKFL